MLDPKKERWGFLIESLQERFPEVTNADLDESQGSFVKLEEIIAAKTKKSPEMIHVILKDLYRDNKVLKADEDFQGIDREQHRPAHAPSNEWEAREDENRD